MHIRVFDMNQLFAATFQIFGEGKVVYMIWKAFLSKGESIPRRSISGKEGVLSSSTFGCININRPLAPDVRRHHTVFFTALLQRLFINYICLWMKMQCIICCIFSDQYVTCIDFFLKVKQYARYLKDEFSICRNYLYSKK